MAAVYKAKRIGRILVIARSPDLIFIMPKRRILERFFGKKRLPLARRAMFLRTISFLFLLALSPAVLAEEPASAEMENLSGGTLTMAPGTAKILHVRAGVRTIIIGNPEIVDVTVLDDQTIAATAKVSGTTNVILLDGHHGQIAQATVTVRPQGRQIRKYQGNSLQTYSCSSGCLPDPKPAPADPTGPRPRAAQGTPIDPAVSGGRVDTSPSDIPPTTGTVFGSKTRP